MALTTAFSEAANRRGWELFAYVSNTIFPDIEEVQRLIGNKGDTDLNVKSPRGDTALSLIDARIKARREEMFEDGVDKDTSLAYLSHVKQLWPVFNLLKNRGAVLPSKHTPGGVSP